MVEPMNSAAISCPSDVCSIELERIMSRMNSLKASDVREGDVSYVRSAPQHGGDPWEESRTVRVGGG